MLSYVHDALDLPNLEALGARIVARALEPYRCDQRPIAWLTWSLWWRQAIGELDWHDVVRRAFNGTKVSTCPDRWHRRRASMRRRRQRLAERMAQAARALAAEGALRPEELRLWQQAIAPALAEANRI